MRTVLRWVYGASVAAGITGILVSVAAVAVAGAVVAVVTSSTILTLDWNRWSS